MIIDCHRHVWSDARGLLDGSLGGAAGLPNWAQGEQPGLAEQDDAPIRGLADCSIILGFKSNLLGVEIPNEFLAEYVAQHADCTVGFAGIDPTDQDAPARAVELITNQGFAGVVLSPGAQGFHPCDSRAMRLYEKLCELESRVIIHYPERWLSAAHLEKSRPALLDEALRTFPSLPVLITSLGWPFVDETVVLLGKHKNVYADVSIVLDRPLRFYQIISNAYQCQIMDKLLFGSGWPYRTVRAAVQALYNINEIPRQTHLPSVPREAVREIVERDSLGLLGIKPPAGLRESQAQKNAREAPAAKSQ